MQQIFTITATLPGMNEIIACAKKHYLRYSDMKSVWGFLVGAAIRKAGLVPMQGPVTVDLHWFEPNAKRDPGNIRAGEKFILDALVKEKIIPSDGQKIVKGLSDTFRVSRTHPRIEVIITQIERGCD